uniref:Charged multivesicular body protein 2Bb n=1 Tax=Sinocyclocheilus rhinocerous TaxID=307959 RepID=A0A673IPZ8_9TELE
MASLFKKKTVDDVIKEQNKELRGTQRQITRDRTGLEKQEKQLEMEIKKMAKTGNREACKVLAKQLVQVRKQKTRSYAVSSKVTSMSTQTKLMNSQMKMAGAMATTTKTMQAVNKKMDPKKTMQTLQNFQKETAKMDMTEEMSKIYLFIYLLFFFVGLKISKSGDVILQNVLQSFRIKTFYNIDIIHIVLRFHILVVILGQT